ncbi:hypothetical protein [Rheinheimera sp.]|uniref:hypothetical protein n=1 Tax=Rheinheimera sp. TaxID=1869214 RepID=UPI00307D36C9
MRDKKFDILFSLVLLLLLIILLTAIIQSLATIFGNSKNWKVVMDLGQLAGSLATAVTLVFVVRHRRQDKTEARIDKLYIALQAMFDEITSDIKNLEMFNTPINFMNKSEHFKKDLSTYSKLKYGDTNFLNPMVYREELRLINYFATIATLIKNLSAYDFVGHEKALYTKAKESDYLIPDMGCFTPSEKWVEYVHVIFKDLQSYTNERSGVDLTKNFQIITSLLGAIYYFDPLATRFRLNFETPVNDDRSIEVLCMNLSKIGHEFISAAIFCYYHSEFRSMNN